ncbi:Multidrug resistance-associated protein 5 [Mizuhopecten yessoensis]|uniref:Multidrug resistance-associated protein 5 n=1 Tax=Mizuhopecten yessoensis TaxID=6573 RepID=A0A210PTB5_MIZYE|nr:Multidrug resistance-associated protein 5 [Mizuhopecten yessoensis]
MGHSPSFEAFQRQRRGNQRRRCVDMFEIGIMCHQHGTIFGQSDNKYIFKLKILEPMWMEELQTYGRQKCSIFRLWLKFIWVRLLIVFIALCFNAIITFLCTGYITDVITRYLEGPETSVTYAIGLIIFTVVGQLLRCCSQTFILFYGTQTGKFRSAILGMTYKKLLKLKSMKGRIASEIITIFASDTLRLLMNTIMVVYLLAMPIYLIIGTVYIYYLIGLWCFVAFAIFIVIFAIQIRKMNEVLASMKLIKMYAWEDSFKKSIMDIRESETKPLLQSTILNAISAAIIPITPSLATVATIATYVSAGNELTASTGFSIVATLTFMRVVVSYAPFSARIFAETLISFERIKRFMLEEEFKPPGRNVVNSDNAIELHDTVFTWDGDNNNNPDDNLTSEESEGMRIYGKLIGICGAVGCGKSSLLQALIGRMPLLTGRLAVDGSVAYAAQQAWIFNGTLRENVLFGNPYNPDWYRKVLTACSLDPDLRILANGDMTEIGDKGINLSGGQKQRVSLARAVYSKRDIYLLDDPLSAVDVHVGQHLFHKCIDKVLRAKTVVLVTHQLQYLKHCDEIYVMDDGEITEHGSHESLLAKEGHYKKLMEQFNYNLDKTNAEGSAFLLIIVYVNSSHHFFFNIMSFPGILTDRETSQSGSLRKGAYMSYVRAAGGKVVIAIVVMLYVCAISSVSFSEWWLGLWIQQRCTIINKIKPFVVFIIPYVTQVMIKAAVTLHNKTVGRVMSAPMQFFDANPTGRIINRFSRDVEDVDVFLPNLMDNLLQVTILIIASIVSVSYNFPFLLIAVVPVGLYCYVIKTMAAVSIRNIKRLENVVRSPLLSHVTTSCYGLSTIVSYSQENNFVNGFKEYSDKTSMGLFLFESCIYWMGLRLDFGGSVLTIIIIIVVLFTKGTISPALAALSLTMSINVSFSLTHLVHECRFLSHSQRMFHYHSHCPSLETGSSKVDENWPSQGRITFSNVMMKYRSDMDLVLRNIIFDILPKQKVGIVGRTGAGKSSLAAALFRLTDISGGQVVIDDVEIGTVSRKLLRSMLSSIPQDPVLFAGTLRYNLDPLGKYTDADIWAALEQVHMKEKMKLLEQTLYLHIAENGEKFSVGERQLICLARAILRQNKILLLDEATASIDTSTDALIQETIRDSFSDCTVLTIAHRLNTVLHCDVILVMEAGRVIETGNPQTLLQNPYSHFSNMIRAQNVQPTEV